MVFTRAFSTFGPPSWAIILPYVGGVGPMGATLACPTGGTFYWGLLCRVSLFTANCTLLRLGLLLSGDVVNRLL